MVKQPMGAETDAAGWIGEATGRIADAYKTTAVDIVTAGLWNLCVVSELSRVMLGTQHMVWSMVVELFV